MKTGNALVDAISSIPFKGNIIPNSWYQAKELRFESGSVNFLALTILADIVFWYRAFEVRDEATDKTVGFRKKFSADKLQRSYESISKKFGVSKRQATDACHFLQDNGLVTLELRNIKKAVRVDGVEQSITVNNVLYIAPVPEVVKRLCECESTSDTPPAERDIIPIPETGEAPTPERETNTDSTYKSSLESKKLHTPDESGALFEEPSSEEKSEEDNRVVDAIIEELFDRYCRKMQKTDLYTLTPKRLKMGRARYKDALKKAKGDAAEAKGLMGDAIDAMAESDYHNARGKYKGQQKYNDWELIFRSTEQFEKMLERYHG